MAQSASYMKFCPASRLKSKEEEEEKEFGINNTVILMSKKEVILGASPRPSSLKGLLYKMSFLSVPTTLKCYCLFCL